MRPDALLFKGSSYRGIIMSYWVKFSASSSSSFIPLTIMQVHCISSDHSRVFQYNLIIIKMDTICQYRCHSWLKNLQHLCLHKRFMRFILPKTLSTILHYWKFMVNNIKILLLLAQVVPYFNVAKVTWKQCSKYYKKSNQNTA